MRVVGLLRLHAVVACLGLSLAGYASSAVADGAPEAPTQTAGAPARVRIGAADWRAESFDGRTTASGERFDMYRLTAASADLPLDSYAAVTNVATGETVVVRINDRPAAGERDVIALSFAAAHRLGVDLDGAPKVKVASVAAPATGLAEAALVVVGPKLGWMSSLRQARLASVSPFDVDASDAIRNTFRRRAASQDLVVTWADDPPATLAGL